MDLKNKKIILKSTNGTVSFFKLLEAEYVFAISLLNLGYSVKISYVLLTFQQQEVLPPQQLLDANPTFSSGIPNQRASSERFG